MYFKLGRLEIGVKPKQVMVPNIERENLAVEANALSTGHPRAMSVQNALQSSLNWVFACMDAISMRGSDIDYRLSLKTRQNGEQVLRPVLEHPFYELWEKPNPLFSSWQMRYLLFAHMNSAGTAFWLMVKNNAGRPEQIWPLEPHRITKEINPDLTLTYKYRTDKGTLVFSNEDVLEFARPNIFNTNSGFSPMMAAGVTIEIAEFIDLYQWRLFKRGAWFPYAITTGKDVSKSDITRVRDDWMTRFQSIDDHFIPPILNTDLKVVEGPSNLDLDLGALDKIQMEKVLGVFRTPKSKVGFSESLNKANALEIDTQWNREVISPLLTQVSSIINAQWLPLYGNADRLVGEFDNPVPQDEEFQLTEDTQLVVQGVLSRNEVRESRGFNPIDAPEMEVPMVPFNLIPVGSSGVSTDGLSDNKSVKGEDNGSAATSPDHLHKIFWTESRRDIFWKQFDDTVEVEAKRWRPVLVKLFDAQEKETQEALAEDVKMLSDRYAGWSKKKVQPDLTKALIDIVPTPAEWIPLFAEDGGKVIADIYEVAGENAVELIGAGVSFDITSPVAVEYIKTRALEYSKLVTEETAKLVADTLSQGFLEGETEIELSKRVATVFDQARDFRTDRIARTETGRAANSAAQEGYRQSGVQKKAWLSSRDPAVRLSHLEADRKYSEEGDPGPIGLEEFFEIEGSIAQHPLDFGVGSLDINCRCVEIPVIVNEEMFRHMVKYMEDNHGVI